MSQSVSSSRASGWTAEESLMKTFPLDLTALKNVNQRLGRSSFPLQHKWRQQVNIRIMIVNTGCEWIWEHVQTCSLRSGEAAPAHWMCGSKDCQGESALFWSQHLSWPEKEKHKCLVCFIHFMLQRLIKGLTETGAGWGNTLDQRTHFNHYIIFSSISSKLILTDSKRGSYCTWITILICISIY